MVNHRTASGTEVQESHSHAVLLAVDNLSSPTG
jgi:hypothetical protein